jgi:hypothetical protein
MIQDIVLKINEHNLMIIKPLENLNLSLLEEFRPLLKKSTINFTNLDCVELISLNVDSPLKGFVQYHSIMEGTGEDYNIEYAFIKKLKYSNRER